MIGSRDVYTVPKNVEEQLYGIAQSNPDIRFIVGENRGADEAFQKTISAIGVRSRSEVYVLDEVRGNKFELPTKMFKSEYDIDTKKVFIKSEGMEDRLIMTDVENPADIVNSREYFTFINSKLLDDADIVVVLWDSSCKFTFSNINILKARGKEVFVFNVRM